MNRVHQDFGEGTSEVYHQWSERWNSGPDGVADEVTWTIKTVIEGL